MGLDTIPTPLKRLAKVCRKAKRSFLRIAKVVLISSVVPYLLKG
jgi:hypothetical protein